jgi:RHS repeat-associated protein
MPDWSRALLRYRAGLDAEQLWGLPIRCAAGFGYQQDAGSGLMLLGHRYYDPSTGRFLTRDPIRDGRNWYSYGGGDGAPTGFVDPTGLTPWLGVPWQGMVKNNTDQPILMLFDLGDKKNPDYRYELLYPGETSPWYIDVDWISRDNGRSWERIGGAGRLHAPPGIQFLRIPPFPRPIPMPGIFPIGPDSYGHHTPRSRSLVSRAASRDTGRRQSHYPYLVDCLSSFHCPLVRRG